ncbi:MAG: hypothetical protein Q7J57_15530 [Gemmobacter sp.]|nr:hypothetical protein [Gemmobacter sp.]
MPEQKIIRDSLMGRDAPPLDPGEVVLTEFTPDRRIFWRDTAYLAFLGSTVIGVMMVVLQNPHVVIGVLGAAAAVVVRAVYLSSETLAARWQMTDRRLLGPGGRRVMLLEIETVRRLMGDVQVVTKAGDKHLLKHMTDGPAVVATILAARDKRRKMQAKAKTA